MAHCWLRGQRLAGGRTGPACLLHPRKLDQLKESAVRSASQLQALSRGGALMISAQPQILGKTPMGGALGCLDAWRGLGVSILVYVKLAAVYFTPVAEQLPP